MTAGQVAELIARYATTIDAPVHTHTTVRSVRRHDDGYEVVTDQGTWYAPTVVAGERRMQPAQGAVASPHAVPPSLTADHADGLPGRRRPAGRRCSRRRRRRQRPSSSPTRSTARGVPSPLRSASTCGCPAPIEDATSCRGWSASECSTSATTRSTTSSRARHVPSPQLVGSPDAASRGPQRADTIAACGSSGGSSASSMGGPSSRGPSQTCARSPT